MNDIQFIGSEALRSTYSTLAESPLWSEREQVLYWVDTIGKKVFRYRPSTDEVAERDIVYRPSALANFTMGGLLLAMKKGVALYDFEASTMRSLKLDGFDFETTVLNDGACDCDGRFWIGSRDKKVREQVGKLYCIDSDYRVKVISDGFVLSNGIAWSKDWRTMFQIDTFPGSVYAYDFSPARGSAINQRIFLDYKQCDWHPDGCAVDADGYLWVAEVDGSRLGRYAPDGTCDRVVSLPVTKPTSLAFGGPDLATMFVTSMRYGLSDGELSRQPLAGTVMMLNVGVKGRPEPCFRGSWDAAPTFESEEDRRRLKVLESSGGNGH